MKSLKGGSIGLIFLDLFLPDCMGDEIANKIREVKEFESIPIVFISASQEKLDAIEVIPNSEKLVKPILPNTILDTASKYLK